MEPKHYIDQYVYYAANKERIQQQLQSELEKFKAIQKDMTKLVGTRQQLDAQLNENKVVQEELDVIEPDGNVYKLMGPVLVKQDLEEAKQTVLKRIEHITAEIKRIDVSIKDVEKKRGASQEILTKLQQQYQQLVTKPRGRARSIRLRDPFIKIRESDRDSNV